MEKIRFLSRSCWLLSLRPVSLKSMWYILFLYALRLGLSGQYTERGGRENDLYTAFSQLPSDRAFQFRRVIRGNAADPGADRRYSRMAQYERIYGSDHNLPDDAGTYCHQFRDLCRHKNSRTGRSRRGNGWLYLSVLRDRNSSGEDIPEVPERKDIPECAGFPAPRGGGNDRGCRSLDPDVCILAECG